MAAPFPRVKRFEQIIGTRLSAQRTWNLMILSEGYTEEEIDSGSFAEDARIIALRFSEVEGPFERMRAAISVFRADVISPESWNSTTLNTWLEQRETLARLALTPAEAAAIRRQTVCSIPFVNSAFRARFCLNGVERLLGGDAKLAREVALADPRTEWVDAVLVIVNTDKIPGGGGGEVAWMSRYDLSGRMAVHEVGHAAFGLEDEYHFVRTNSEHARYAGAEPLAPNVSTAFVPRFSPWRELVTPNTPLPTSAAAAACPQLTPAQLPDGTFNVNPAVRGNVGAFEGGLRHLCGIYRPQLDCRMRDMTQPFCHVCAQVITERLGGQLFGSSATRPERGLDGGSHLVVLESPRRDVEAHLLTYDIVTGDYALYPCLPFAESPATTTPIGGNISPFWTAMTGVKHDGKPYVLAVQRGTGSAALYRFFHDRVPVSLEHVWGEKNPGFAVALPHVIGIVPFTHQQKLHWIEYDIVSGDGTIRRIDPGSNTPTTVRTVPIGAGRIGLAPLEVPYRTGTHFISCEVMSGKLQVHRIEDDDVDLKWSRDGFLGRGVTDLVPLIAWDGTPFVLTYSRFTGWLRFFRVQSLGEGLEFVYREFIGPAPFAFLPFIVVGDERCFYLRYRWPMIPGQQGAIAAFQHG